MSRGVSRTVRETSWSVHHSTGGLRSANLDKRQGRSESPGSQQNYVNSYSSYLSPRSDSGYSERRHRSGTRETVTFNDVERSSEYHSPSRQNTTINAHKSPYVSPRSQHNEHHESRYQSDGVDGFLYRGARNRDRSDSPSRSFKQMNSNISPYASPRTGKERYETSYRSDVRKTTTTNSGGGAWSATMKCPFGYIGCRAVDARMQCNRIRSEAFDIIPTSWNRVLLRAPNGKYVRMDGNADTWADGEEREAEEFVLAKRADSTLSLRAGSGRYLRWQYGGAITADALDEEENTLFNFSSVG